MPSKSLDEAIAELNKWENKKRELDTEWQQKLFGGDTSPATSKSTISAADFIAQYGGTITFYLDWLRNNKRQNRAYKIECEWEPFLSRRGFMDEKHYHELFSHLAEATNQQSPFYWPQHAHTLRRAKDDLKQLFEQQFKGHSRG